MRAQEEKSEGSVTPGRTKNGHHWYLRPKTVYALILGIQFIILALLIAPLASGGMLLAGLLLLSSLVLRLRVSLVPEWMLVDCGLFCVAGLVEPGLVQFLFVFIYYFAWHNKLLYALLPAAVSLVLLDMPHYLLPIQALVSGYVLFLWNHESLVLYEQVDTLRQRLYRMEQTEMKLLADYQSTARMSQLRERQRLAEQLHDNLGHELTAAQLSVRSIGTLLDQCDSEKAGKAQQKASERLDAALRQLKQAVSRLEPEAETNLKSIVDLFDDFIYPVDLTQHGDAEGIQVYHLQLLHTAVKEALTNIAKHALPRRVSAVLDTSGSIIKITIENDGIKPGLGEPAGNGLRYLRKRVESVRGSLSASYTGAVFRIIIILPKEYA